MTLLGNLKKRLQKKQSIIHAFKDRKTRAEFIYKKFKNYLTKSILDVGSSNNYLKEYLPKNVEYVSVDIVGEPTYIIDLEKESLTRFDTDSFETVICTEVLEHLDNLHDVFDDLCRVARKYLIISLPNNWINFKYALIRNEGISKYYGLPIDKPHDRHKWFFNYTQAYNFLKERGLRNQFKIIYSLQLPIINPSIYHHILNFFLKLYYKGRFNYENLNYAFLFTLLKKKV
ncbi:MAG: class I SAM-dependent methyltransferase [Candidatus Helarchaeota archaeon]